MGKHILELYVNGSSLTSVEAIETLQNICEEHLHGNCEVEIVDVLKNPERAEEAGILAIPTLIRKWPLPESRIIGALTIKSRVLAGLGITNGNTH
ncbi:circadian clock KaiB family protein [Pontibacter ramchanderi]|nr:circadian clock KaiB family protein [Pontibacter ramchanderi]